MTLLLAGLLRGVAAALFAAARRIDPLGGVVPLEDIGGTLRRKG